MATPGGLCCYCHIPVGITVKCSCEDCVCSYHMTCHYYYGGFIHVDPSQKSYIGGGTHPRVTTFCFNHDHVATASGTHAVEPRCGRPRAGGGEAQ